MSRFETVSPQDHHTTNHSDRQIVAGIEVPGTSAASRRLVPWQGGLLLGFLLLIAVAFVAGPSPLRTLLIGAWIALYTYNNLYRWWLAGHSLAAVQTGHFVTPPIVPLAEEKLPRYTILLPLRHEAPVVPQLIAAIRALKYPADKLQVLCLLRSDDLETREALARCGITEKMIDESPIDQSADTPLIELLILPEELPVGTKPAACNWGLANATGELLVIYDAEDLPEPAQLLEAAAALQGAPEDVACVQSIKRVYNGATNWLTRLYQVEALTWHRLQLPGVAIYERLSPLHGSGVHFRIEVLRAINGWDFYNVAEDCDMGVRLYRAGYRIVALNSVTGEEAPETLSAWMGQRTRWNKGFVQSFLVHTRHPGTLLRELGLRRTIAFSTLTGITFLNLLIGLPTWLGATLWSATHSLRGGESIATVVPFSNARDAFLLTSSAIVLLALAVLLQMAGAIIARQWRLIPYGLLTPLYWILLSIAVWRSVWQLVLLPFGWEKTTHGSESRGSESSHETINSSLASTALGKKDQRLSVTGTTEKESKPV
jgi:cellulose synthase/poly-beta-1,6-N-acetylglucosamine synthase-like glycosyltransferase